MLIVISLETIIDKFRLLLYSVVDHQHENNLILYIVNTLFCSTYYVSSNNYYLL